MNAAAEITLQINVCAGDLAYADTTVGALVATHRPQVGEVLIVADACRPQSTPLLHTPSRFPASVFASRIDQLRRKCRAWLDAGLVDRVEWIDPNAPGTPALNRRYLGRATAWTHDHLGHALTAYFAGWDRPRTRYVAHFDADIVLHQAPGYRWLPAAVHALEQDSRALAASPRIAPPLTDHTSPLLDAQIAGNGWQPSWPLIPFSLGWNSPWLSTRAHLLDRERLAGFLPLVSGASPFADAIGAFVNRVLFPVYDYRPWLSDPSLLPTGLGERVASRLARRIIPPFPLPPEVLVHRTALRRGLNCIYLGDPRAWYIHPDTKPPELVALMPRIVDAVSIGAIPPAQRGFTGIRSNDWLDFSFA